MAKKCPNCGNEVSQEVKFCSNCGSEIPGLNEEAVISEKPGDETKSEAKPDPKKKKRLISIIAAVSAVLIGVVAGAVILMRPKLESISAAYGGDTAHGIMLDNNNVGIMVIGKYDNGDEKQLEEWTIEEPKALARGKSVTVNIAYQGLSTQLTVESPLQFTVASEMIEDGHFTFTKEQFMEYCQENLPATYFPDVKQEIEEGVMGYGVVCTADDVQKAAIISFKENEKSEVIVVSAISDDLTIAYLYGTELAEIIDASVETQYAEIALGLLLSDSYRTENLLFQYSKLGDYYTVSISPVK